VAAWSALEDRRVAHPGARKFGSVFALWLNLIVSAASTN
jgi:hypothetical protein